MNIHEAKTHLSRLVERAEAGEETVIARAGRPVARLVPYRDRTAPRAPGRWRGQITLSADFDAVNEQDPFDRMLVAQATRLDAVLVTRDAAFDAYEVDVLRA